MSLWLAKEELVELTGYKTSARQYLALNELNIPYQIRPADGVPLVRRSYFSAETKLTPKRRGEPNLDALRGDVNG